VDTNWLAPSARQSCRGDVGKGWTKTLEISYGKT
jgi:hypothetical protein